MLSIWTSLKSCRVVRVKKPFEKIVGKEENAGNHNLFYPSQNKSQFFGRIYFVVGKWMGECNNILSAYTLYRHLG